VGAGSARFGPDVSYEMRRVQHEHRDTVAPRWSPGSSQRRVSCPNYANKPTVFLEGVQWQPDTEARQSGTTL
jgi:hypothetical protein